MKGILFKDWKIKAIAENPDKEWQTRRIIKLPTYPDPNPSPDEWVIRKGANIYVAHNTKINYQPYIKPRYQVGETVYIKEAHCIECFKNDSIKDACYKTDEDTLEPVVIDCDKVKWRSPLFLPEWATRYFIKITSVTPQRLQDITPEDCEKEGIDKLKINWKFAFQELWDSINGKTYPWDGNWWVWRYCFGLVESK